MPAYRRLAAGAVALACAAAISAAPARAETYGSRLGAHSMLYLDSPAVQQEALFRAAHEAGVRSIRLDFTMGAVFGFLAEPDFTAVDHVNALARRYHLQVDAVLTGLPFWLADCPPGTAFMDLSKCPPRLDAEAEWARMVTAVVRRSPAVHFWELGNEPDVPGGRFFIGSPAAYARMAAVTARAVRAARRSAAVVLGGTSRLDRGFLRAVLHDAHDPLVGEIDVASVHLRGGLTGLRRQARACVECFRHEGVRGPLFVTETGYASRSEHQRDPGLVGGERDQARWIARGPRELIAGGAARVFVTLRDGPEFGDDSAFASEALVYWPGLGPRRSCDRQAGVRSAAAARLNATPPVNVQQPSRRPEPSDLRRHQGSIAAHLGVQSSDRIGPRAHRQADPLFEASQRGDARGPGSARARILTSRMCS